MAKYGLHWILAERGRETVLSIEEMEAMDREGAKRKALALFSDGGAIHGANRIRLLDEGADSSFWEHP
jgi:hypothetical protein